MTNRFSGKTTTPFFGHARQPASQPGAVVGPSGCFLPPLEVALEAGWGGGFLTASEQSSGLPLLGDH